MPFSPSRRTPTTPPSSSATTTPRVIVIGAGIAGLAVARELQHRRYNVLVVEARPRAGGRLRRVDLVVPLKNDDSSNTELKRSLRNHAPSAKSTTTTTAIDVGGALIHGIDESPLYELVQQLGIPTHDVSENCLLLKNDGTAVLPKEDEAASQFFNDCLEETFARIPPTTTTNPASPQEKDKDAASLPLSFGKLYRQVCEERMQSQKINRTLVEWHKANLEVGCGASLESLGYTWNEDEPYGFDGAHVALESSWNTVIEGLKEGLEICYNTQVQSIHYGPETPKEEGEAGNESRATKRRRPAHEDAKTSNPSTPTRKSRRLQGEDAHVRRSARSNKGTPPANKFSISNFSNHSLSYDEVTLPHRKRQSKPSKQKVRLVVKRQGQRPRILEADIVICTLPLGVLKIPPNLPGHVSFDPPLPPSKQTAIIQLGCGLLNKCAISFPRVFWQDSEFLGVAEDQPHLILNASIVTGKPIVVFMFGGDYARTVETQTDAQVMEMCLDVLRRVCKSEKDVPAPLDYMVTRWSKDCFSRGAFVYIPPGVNGQEQLEHMSEPILGEDGKPLVLFAGEHTTPYHPSTIHGAFLSGIREAYRLDLTLEPALNDFLDFQSDHMYTRTFPVKRRYKSTRPPTASPVPPSRTPPPRRNGVMTLRKRRPKQKSKGNGRSALFRSERGAKMASTHNVSSSSSSEALGPTSPLPQGLSQMSLEDRLLLRSYESYRSWSIIHDKVFPVLGSDRHKTVAQLRSSHQQLVRRQEQSTTATVLGREKEALLQPWLSLDQTVPTTTAAIPPSSSALKTGAKGNTLDL